ncbi:MAG TPA: hypothetical protein VFB42_03470 [Gaiellaceae bacterium]|nr:hypothetical protein [Gaiellaceae bacterium]
MGRTVRAARAAAAVLSAAGVAAGVALGAAPSASVARTVDTRLCGFPLEVTVRSRPAEGVGTTALRFAFGGGATITLRNGSSGRSATLSDSGAYTVDTTTGSVAFGGHHVWYWATGKRVPFATTDGPGRLEAPSYVLAGARAHARALDPCALVAPSPPPAPRTGPAPWGLPPDPLARMARAGVAPLIGTVIRHDHVHLDVLVDGRRVTVPGGIGLAEPVDRGPCPKGTPPRGDCATGHGLFAEVANSPVHTHSASGLVHIESDRRDAFTLGQLFDLWGVRLDARCVGGYCTGGGNRLGVFVGGRRVTGDPRAVVLGDHQEIAVVFGGRGAFRSVPAAYTGGWPGAGCGGAGERSCLP